jgi:hypothetical protein
MLILLFVLMLGDYLLTYFGMRAGFIMEGNGLMRWLMDLPLWDGLFVKIGISLLLLVPFVWARTQRKRIYNYALYIIFAAYGIIYIMHGYWIYTCLL